MQKVLKHGAALLRRVVWLGMGLQVLLGLVWMLNNMGIEHSFGVDWSGGGPESRPFLQWGALYPFIVKMTMGMVHGLPIPYYSVIYCLQLAAALGSGWFLLGKVSGWRGARRWYGAMILLSVPMAMQNHLALLPYSFTGSAVLMELALGHVLWKQEKWSLRTLLWMYFFWLLTAFLMPEYLWLGAIPLGMLALGYLWRGRKQWRSRGLAGMLVLGSLICLIGAGSVYRDEEVSGLSAMELVVARCSWSRLHELYGIWPQEIQDTVGFEALVIAGSNPEGLYEGFFEGFDLLSREQARGYLEQMLDSAWKVGGKQLVLELGYDGVGYLLPGLIIPKHLNGEGFISLTGVNYWHFIRGFTGWSGIYMYWYCIWCLLAPLLAVMARILELPEAGRSREKFPVAGELKGLAPGLFMALWAAGYYTMYRIGTFDYKIISWWTIIWCVGTLMALKEQEKKEE